MGRQALHMNCKLRRKCQRREHSGIAHRLRILSDGFDSRLEPIAFDIYTGWLLTRRAQARFAVSLNLLNFLFNLI